MSLEQHEINIILTDHSKWLNDPTKGIRANLRYASLKDANLEGADLP